MLHQVTEFAFCSKPFFRLLLSIILSGLQFSTSSKYLILFFFHFYFNFATKNYGVNKVILAHFPKAWHKSDEIEFHTLAQVAM